MLAVALTDLDSQLAEIVRQVHEQREPVVLTRGGSRLAVVLPPEVFDRLQAAADGVRLRSAIEEVEREIERGEHVENEVAMAELGETPPTSPKQAAPPKQAPVDRRAAIGMDAGKVWIAADFDGPLVEPAGAAPSPRRPHGLCAGEFTTPDDFDAPLPDEILDAFEGRRPSR